VRVFSVASRFAAAILLALALALPAGAMPIYLEDGVAADGHDTVAYFTEGRAVKGDARFQHDWMGAKWNFSSAANRDLFAANPEKYAPQYGGFCAYGVASGYKPKGDGEAWHIHEGKLYLNYNRAVRVLWRTDIPGYTAKADANWPQLKDR
jgi:YHS domain-containing protein